jgi:hypothetical protein
VLLPASLPQEDGNKCTCNGRHSKMHHKRACQSWTDHFRQADRCLWSGVLICFAVRLYEMRRGTKSVKPLRSDTSYALFVGKTLLRTT